MKLLKIIAILVATTILSMANNKPIKPYSYQKMLNVGMDVDWCKTKDGRYWARYWHAKGVNVPKLFKKRGFSHVRIRVKDSVLSDPKLMSEIKNMVDDSLRAGLIPIVAYQGRDFKNNPTSDRELQKVIDWWSKVAKTFKNYPYTLSYDLIIENTKKVKKHNDRLNLLYKKTADAIRKIDKNRIIIVAPNKISNPYMLDKLVVPSPKDYMMVEWHFYASGPSRTRVKKLWTTGTTQEKDIVLNKINYAYNWSKKYNIPTWVGAWMTTNYNKVNKNRRFADGAPAGGEYTLEEQKKFAKFMRDALSAKGIPFAVNSDTKYFNRKTNQWYGSVSEVLDIILGK